MDALNKWKLIGGIVIFVTGLVGCAVSPMARLFGRRRVEDVSPRPVADEGAGVRLGRVLRVIEVVLMSVGCGVMLATGLVHVLPVAQDNLSAVEWLPLGDDEEFYPLAEMLCLAAVLLVYVFHIELHHLVEAGSQPTGRMHVLEGGLVVHSVLIGFALGSTQDETPVRGLAIALMFHQLCEGFAMGSAIAHAADGEKGISNLHQAVMVMLFALATPVGVLIGHYSIRNEDQAASEASLGAQGVLEAVAAGILICSSLCDFMPHLYGAQNASCFPAVTHEHEPNSSGSDAELGTTNDQLQHGHSSGHSHGSVSGRLCAHIGILLGSAAMAVLAIWA